LLWIAIRDNHDVTAQGYTPIDMIRVADEFYLSLNLSAMPPEFWAGSIISDPGDRPLICQASAWDFCNRLDYRWLDLSVE